MNMQKQKPIWSKILAMLCALALCISMVPAASAARPSTTSTVSKVTVDAEGISEFWTETGETAIGSTGETIGNIRYSFSNSSLVIETTNDTKLPKTITFFAVVNYQPTITSSNDGVSAIASDYGDNWWMITISLANTTANEVILNAEAVPTYTVTVSETTQDVGYTLIKGSSDTVKQGESYQFYVIPKTGYQAPNVTVTRGGSASESVTPEDGLYTVANIQSDITITIGNAQLQQYTVNFVSGDGYSFEGANNTTIAADGTATVNYNSNVSFKVNLDDDYNKSNVTVYANSSELEANGAGVYIINNITADQTVIVSGVEKNTYKVTLPTDWTGYTISTVDGTSVSAGGTFTFTVTPAAGYTITKVTANGQELSSTNNQYSITVNQNTTIAVTATATQYPVNVTAPNATVEVNNQASYGNLTFTVTPEAGYKVDSVTYNGATLPKSENGHYTISVTGDVNIVVTTSPLVNVTLTTTVTATGDTTYTIVVKTFPGEVTGDSAGISVVGYGTLYSNQSFSSQSLKDAILGLTLKNTLTQQKVSDDPVVYSYSKEADFPLDELINTFSYTFNNSSSKDRYGAGWIKLSDGQNSWIVFSESVHCQ